MDGLPFSLLASDLVPWLQKYLGDVQSQVRLWLVLAADGRASGRAVLQFRSWEAAKLALQVFEAPI